MRYCPINLSPIEKNQDYNPNSLKKMAVKLIKLKPLNYTVAEQQEQALQRIGKMSIQGVQPKLSAVLNIKQAQFDIVNKNGKYIIKIQSPLYKELPQNESLSMLLAKSIDIETPIFGLVKTIDNNYSYFIKRFDREGRNKKLAVEDFCQLASLDRDTKYNSSMEQVITDIRAKILTT
jgi:serine/threonine-protein kinase HipA